MKLWVDDFRDAPDDTWNTARTTEEAIRAIATMEFDEISLDHDIENRPETFQPVAYFIGVKYFIHIIKDGEKFYRMDMTNKNIHSPNDVPKITIHSGNPVGAKNMADILSSYGIGSIIKPIHLWEKNIK